MRFLTLLLLLLTAFQFVACHSDNDEDEPGSIIDPVERPVWTVFTPDDASVNMTVYVHIPEALTVSDTDLIGAFIDDKCRAIGRNTDNNTFVLTVVGTSGEQSPIELIYYNANAQRIFTDSGHLRFMTDDVVGLEEPYELTIE